MLRRNAVVPSESQTTLAAGLSLSFNPNSSNRQLDKIQESEGPETELKLVEIPNVFSDETSLSVVGVVIQICSRNVLRHAERKGLIGRCDDPLKGLQKRFNCISAFLNHYIVGSSSIFS